MGIKIGDTKNNIIGEKYSNMGVVVNLLSIEAPIHLLCLYTPFKVSGFL